MALAPTPENFRAEIARYSLSRNELCSLIGMHPDVWSRFVTGRRPLQGWAAHNIGWAINTATGRYLIDVTKGVGVLPAPRSGRSAGWNRPNRVRPLRGGPKKDQQAG